MSENNGTKMKDDEEMQQEMELQLHEQYAVNNNSNMGSVITLLVAMLASVSGYGYVYIHCITAFSSDWGNFCASQDTFYMDALLVTAIATIIVLLIMAYLCVSIGCRQRMEQFVTYAIRNEYYRKEEDKYNRIFPKSYTPFDKRGWDIVQSPYIELIWCIRVIMIAIVLSLLLRLPIVNIDMKTLMLFFLIVTIIIAFIILFSKDRFSFLHMWNEKIKEREDYYKSQGKSSLF